MLTRNCCFSALMIGAVLLCSRSALAQGCLEYQGRQHCPDSNTLLELVGGTLVASAVDETPLITITTASDHNFGTRYEPIHFEHDRTNLFAVANVGMVNSIPNQTLGNLYFAFDPGTNILEVTGSSSLTSDGITIEIRNNGEVVGTAFNFDGSITASTETEPGIIETGMITAQQPYSLVARFETAAEWSVENTIATGDELVFTPQGRVDRINALEFAVVEGVFIPTFTIIDEYGIRLRATGSCPGAMNVTITGGTPSGHTALVAAFRPGTIRVPSGPCAGMPLGLNRTARIVQTRTADAQGTTVFAAIVPQPVCGNVLIEAIDGPTCTSSNVERIE